MTTPDIHELERLANEATDGPWEAYYPDGSIFPESWDVHPLGLCTPIDGEGMLSKDEAAYIAAANPATMRKLIERLRDAEDALGQGDEEMSAYFAKWHGGSE